jgi:hypothetical protein
MASYAAIADASETLVELLRDRITERSDVVSVGRSEIALVSPDDVGADSDVRLSLFLYDVSANPVLKNQQDVPLESGGRKETPLALDLRYVLTAFPAQTGGDDTATSLDQQRILGLAMQVFYDNSILGPDQLPASLADRDLQINMVEESLQAMSDVWTSFGETAMQPSVTYEVGPVLIDSTAVEDVERVTETGTDYRRADDSG